MLNYSNELPKDQSDYPLITEEQEPTEELKLEETTRHKVDNSSQNSSPDQGSNSLEDPSKDDHYSQNNQHNHPVANDITVNSINTIQFDLPHDIQSIKQLQAIIKSYQ